MANPRMDANWARVKSQIETMFGDFDDSELKKARGNLNKMVNLIHEKTGQDKTLIIQKMAAIF